MIDWGFWFLFLWMELGWSMFVLYVGMKIGEIETKYKFGLSTKKVKK